MQETKVCSCCNTDMQPSATDFTLSKRDAVYVVEGVPVFECPQCGETSMTMETARRVESFVSGRAMPIRQRLAFIYDWSQSLVPVPSEGDTPTEIITRALHEPVGTAVGI